MYGFGKYIDTKGVEGWLIRVMLFNRVLYDY